MDLLWSLNSSGGTSLEFGGAKDALDEQEQQQRQQHQEPLESGSSRSSIGTVPTTMTDDSKPEYVIMVQSPCPFDDDNDDKNYDEKADDQHNGYQLDELENRSVSSWNFDLSPVKAAATKMVIDTSILLVGNCGDDNASDSTSLDCSLDFEEANQAMNSIVEQHVTGSQPLQDSITAANRSTELEKKKEELRRRASLLVTMTRGRYPKSNKEQTASDLNHHPQKDLTKQSSVHSDMHQGQGHVRSSSQRNLLQEPEKNKEENKCGSHKRMNKAASMRHLQQRERGSSTAGETSMLQRKDKGKKREVVDKEEEAAAAAEEATDTQRGARRGLLTASSLHSIRASTTRETKRTMDNLSRARSLRSLDSSSSSLEEQEQPSALPRPTRRGMLRAGSGQGLGNDTVATAASSRATRSIRNLTRGGSLRSLKVPTHGDDCTNDSLGTQSQDNSTAPPRRGIRNLNQAGSPKLLDSSLPRHGHNGEGGQDSPSTTTATAVPLQQPPWRGVRNLARGASLRALSLHSVCGEEEEKPVSSSSSSSLHFQQTSQPAPCGRGGEQGTHRTDKVRQRMAREQERKAAAAATATSSHLEQQEHCNKE